MKTTFILFFNFPSDFLLRCFPAVHLVHDVAAERIEAILDCDRKRVLRRVDKLLEIVEPFETCEEVRVVERYIFLSMIVKFPGKIPRLIHEAFASIFEVILVFYHDAEKVKASNKSLG